MECGCVSFNNVSRNVQALAIVIKINLNFFICDDFSYFALVGDVCGNPTMLCCEHVRVWRGSIPGVLWPSVGVQVMWKTGVFGPDGHCGIGNLIFIRSGILRERRS